MSIFLLTFSWSSRYFLWLLHCTHNCHGSVYISLFTFVLHTYIYIVVLYVKRTVFCCAIPFITPYLRLLFRIHSHFRLRLGILLQIKSFIRLKFIDFHKVLFSAVCVCACVCVVVVVRIFMKSTSLRAQELFMNYSIRIRHNKSCEAKISSRRGEIYDQLHMLPRKLVNNISTGWLNNEKKQKTK